MKKIIMVMLSGLFAQGSFAELIYSAEFNTTSNVEAWVGSGQVSGLRQATAVGSGGEGVLTCNNIAGAAPSLTYDPTPDIALPAGESWNYLEIRFRQLSKDPQAGGVPVAFNNTGTLLELAAVGAQVRMGLFDTRIYTGTTSYASDTFAMTVTEDANHWVQVSVNFSSAPYLKSHDLPKILLTTTSNSVLNFEVDYVRLYDTAVVPEPATLGLFTISSAVVLLLRRYCR